MRTIERSSAFRRDYKREAKGPHGKVLDDLLASTLTHLAADISLPQRNRDHELKGAWAGCRECHLRPDLLLVYRKPDGDLLQLVRLGSHSELFG